MHIRVKFFSKAKVVNANYKAANLEEALLLVDELRKACNNDIILAVNMWRD